MWFFGSVVSLLLHGGIETTLAWIIHLPMHAAGTLADLLPQPTSFPFQPVATPTPTATGAEDAQTIAQFFQNLYDNGIKIIVYAIALFFFGWGAIGLMFPGERSQDHARSSLYRALGGLALALLATAISKLIEHAVPR